MPKIQTVRDNTWLKKQLKLLLKTYFADVKLTNSLEIKFGREAKYRFGSIKLFKHKRFFGKPEKSVITITSVFAKESVPVRIVQYTIGHELCHYLHGFSSANKRLFRYPHHGGIVNKELRNRGAEELIIVFKKWLKNYRQQILHT